MDLNKKTARIVGILFLFAIATYGTGNGLIESILNTPDYLSNISFSKMQVIIGAILMLCNSAIVVGIAVIMLPILKEHNQNIAYGYLSSRIIESILLVLGVISLLLLITISQEFIKAGSPAASHFQTLSTLAIKGNYFAYQIAMIALALGSLLFCFSLYQTTLIPRFLSIWGFIGYAVFLMGSLFEILGFSVGLVLSVPGGLFELALGIWLIFKGFNSPLIA